MAAIPSSGSLVATHDYYRRRLGSTSSNSSCGSAEYSGEVIPHHPGLPKSDPGHWWASFFFGEVKSSIHDNCIGIPREVTQELSRLLMARSPVTWLRKP
uniref:Pancreatic progenitor cell differentiation and proliferation factor n=1 Tax=Monodelphis domestica TaxID=13616 RepID=F6Y282_MONDO